MTEILHITPLSFGDGGVWGGAERFALELARAQAFHRPTRLLAFGERAQQWRDGPLEIMIAPRRATVGNPMNPISEQVFRMIASARVVHLHQWNTLLTSSSVFYAAALRRSVYATDHGGDGPNPLARLHPERVVDSLLAVSQYSAKLLPQFGNRSSVIYCGVDVTRFTPPTDNGHRPSHVIYVGRIKPQKGIDTLISALDQRINCHIYGRVLDVPYRRLLGQLADGKNCYFHEDATDNEIIEAYRCARVAVLPSVYQSIYGDIAPKSELFGIALAEAMACATPAICSDVGGMPEVVVHGKTGYVVPPGEPDALAEALHAIVDAPRHLWQQFSNAARDHVRTNFTWERAAQRCFAVYDKSERYRTWQTKYRRDDVSR